MAILNSARRAKSGYESASRFHRIRFCLLAVAATGCLFSAPRDLANANQQSKLSELATDEDPRTGPSAFSGERAYSYLEQVCEIGPRPSGSEGMKRQQRFLETHFESIGGKVYYQTFESKHPQTGRQVEMKNMLVRWHTDRPTRLLVCCHYDTRPFPDRDPVNPRGKFIGANDGGSGVALLCELGHHMPALEGEMGVDLMFFDAEEFVFVSKRDPLFLGSTYFANEYAKGRVNAKYFSGVLLDMVADKNLQIYCEGNSLNRAPRVTQHIWEIAARLQISEFVPHKGHTIRDDHIPLIEIARLEVCDIIDFDFPVSGNNYWHTQQDVIENCSAESLGKVGTVVLAWLREMQTRK